MNLQYGIINLIIIVLHMCEKIDIWHDIHRRPLNVNEIFNEISNIDSITSPEFYTVIFNIIQDEIREKYSIDW